MSSNNNNRNNPLIIIVIPIKTKCWWLGPSGLLMRGRGLATGGVAPGVLDTRHNNYQGILNQSWGTQFNVNDKAKLITTKLKNLRKCLREWQASMKNLKTVIANVRTIILFLEVLAEFRDLSLAEWNFKKLLDKHLLSLLERQRIY